MFLVQDMVSQLHRFITALDKYHQSCNEIMKEADIFPIEVDLPFELPSQTIDDTDDDDAVEEEKTNDADLLDIEKSFERLSE